MLPRVMTPDPSLLLPHRLPGPPVEARLVVRENRFLARCTLADGTEVEAHVPDRGRLATLLVPGARVWLYAAPASATRRTPWSLLVAEEPGSGVLVAIDPAGANARVRRLIDAGLLPDLDEGWTVRAEAPLGRSRVDFLLTRGPVRLVIEVKSVGVVRGGVALFPDAPTERGVRHLEELARFARSGEGRARVLFVAQRGDAQSVAADRQIDPAFASVLDAVAASVELRAVRLDVRPEGCVFTGAIPVVGLTGG